MVYKIKKVIARNLYSEVMIGECCNDSQSHNVIIKTVLPPVFGNVLERLTLAKSLQHCGIPKLVDFGECCDRGTKKYYTTNMHFTGITLTQLLQRLAVLKLKLPLSVALHIISSISDILQYTHHFQTEKSGFVPHGNICPDNVLISFDGSVFLTDTGIADLVTYRYNGTGLVKNEHTIFSHPDIHGGKASKRRHEFYSLGILFLCMLKGNDEFLLCMDKLQREKNSSLTAIFSSLEPGVDKILTVLTGERGSGAPALSDNIEEVKSCIGCYIQNNGIVNGKNQCMLLLYALFNDVLQIPDNIQSKVDNELVNAQFFDSVLVTVLQKTILNGVVAQNSSPVVQDYKIETEPVSMDSLPQYLNPPEQQYADNDKCIADSVVIENDPITTNNIQKTNTSVFEAFSGVRVDTSIFYRAEKEHPFANLIIRK